MTIQSPPSDDTVLLPLWGRRIAVYGLLAVMVLVLFWTNAYLFAQYTEQTRNNAQLRLALYTGSLMADVRRNAVVPQLLARDPALGADLVAQDYTQSRDRLVTLAAEMSGTSVFLLDQAGKVVAATGASHLAPVFESMPQFTALDTPPLTHFVTLQDETQFVFAHWRQIREGSRVLGSVISVVDLGRFENLWAGSAEAILMKNADGTIIFATEPRWIGQSERAALRSQPPKTAIERALAATSYWSFTTAADYIEDRAVLRVAADVPFEGWSLVSFTTYASVRQKVNAVLALELMGFALLLALVLYGLGRRSALQLAFMRRESGDLRALNARLEREIAERERAQGALKVAEQTLEQHSKLAALGEMSAAVSHELNQPLAAMKTYLAGAKLLITRGRPDDAVSAFRRIDDLIDRMGAITKQLKSYARKGSDLYAPVVLQEAMNDALSLMESQLNSARTAVQKSVPKGAVTVLADRVRIEQVIINLLRNALDATKTAQDAQISISLHSGPEMARLIVRDNGEGLKDFENLFEPFYTTKQPGEGVGLGLAICAGIVKEFGGRLLARNASPGPGAEFEVQLPIYKSV